MKNIKNKINNSNGFILLTTSLGIFVVLSFFAFYIARLSTSEIATNTNYINDIRTRNLALTGLDHGVQLIKTSYSSLSNPVTGTFNNGQYSVTLLDNQDETGSPLPFNHYHLLNSTAKIGNVERNARIIVSSYPDAFNLAFYGKNDGGVTFSSASTINGDIYFNGSIGSINLSSGKVAYTSLTNPGDNAVFHGNPLVQFPGFDNTYYLELLNSINGSYFSGSSEPMLSFDGTNDYAAIQNMYYTEPGEISKLTVSAWVKVPLDGGNWSIVDFDRSEYYTCAVGISNIHGEGDYVGFHTRAISGGIKDMKSTATMRDNEWHHIVWVFDSEEVYDKKIYIDGQLDSQQDAYSTNVNLGSGANRYGFFGDGSEASSYNANRNGLYYQGHMDQISIWHRAFSASEISSLLNVDINATGLVAYWPMNEGTGNSISDIGPNNYNATTYNGPSWGTRGANETIVNDQTITLSSINNDNTLMQQSALTLNNCTINGPGKILCMSNLTISDGTVINGNVIIISGGNVLINEGSIVGSNTTPNCIIYSSSSITISGSTVYGLILCNGSSFSASGSSNIYGAIYTLSTNTIVSESSIIGSIVSKYTLNLSSSNLIKGSLPPIYGNEYGFKNMVVPGSYQEY